MVRRKSGWLKWATRFPHTRGDGPVSVIVSHRRIQFSPHAWGWSDGTIRMLHTQVVFPTRVGMVRRPRLTPCGTSCFPHTRGDGPRLPAPLVPALAFSPHAWGWSGTAGRQNRAGIVFPTRVGMVRLKKTIDEGRRRFPHTRGDGPSANLSDVASVGFSPHAWGWSANSPRATRSSAVFPTRVGMVRS